jgi:hypothetical protein
MERKDSHVLKCLQRKHLVIELAKLRWEDELILHVMD